MKNLRRRPDSMALRTLPLWFTFQAITIFLGPVRPGSTRNGLHRPTEVRSILIVSFYMCPYIYIYCPTGSSLVRFKNWRTGSIGTFLCGWKSTYTTNNTGRKQKGVLSLFPLVFFLRKGRRKGIGISIPREWVRERGAGEMDQIMNKAGTYWFSKKAGKEISSVGDDINVSFSSMRHP